MKQMPMTPSMENIFEQFKAIDLIRDEFKQLFLKETSTILVCFFPFINISKKLEEAINTYATHILNATESVIDKDKHYPYYRMLEELEHMRKVVNRPVIGSHDPALIQVLNTKVKALIVEHFHKVFDLSGNGFRLLESNVLMYNRHFTNDFYIIQKEA